MLIKCIFLEITLGYVFQKKPKTVLNNIELCFFRVPVPHRHGQQYGEGMREGWGWVVEGKSGGNWDMCNSVNNKNKEQKVILVTKKIFLGLVV